MIANWQSWMDAWRGGGRNGRRRRRPVRDWEASQTALESRVMPTLPVLMVIANQDFYYQEYSHTRQSLETAGLQVAVAAATTDVAHPHPNSGQGGGSGDVQPDLALGSVNPADYSAIVFVGGWGSSSYQYAFTGTYDNPAYNGSPATETAANNLINSFIAQDKHVAAICHGVSVLAWARVNGQSPLAGRSVAGYEGSSPSFTRDGVPHPNTPDHVLIEENLATVFPAYSLGNPGSAADDVWVDGKIITAQNWDSAALFGQTIANQLLAPPPVNVAPVVGNVPASLAYMENAAPLLLAPAGTVADANGGNLDGGVLLAQYTAGARPTDRLTIRHQGIAAGQVGVSGTDVTFGGVVVGSFVGGTGTAALKVTFNAASSPAAAQAVLRNIQFHNVSDNPTNFGANPTRSLRFRITDGDGGVSGFAQLALNVTAVADAPTIGAFDGATTYTENGTGILVDGNATVADPDTPNLNGGQLTIDITANGEATDRLAIRHQGLAAGQVGVSGNNVTHSGAVVGSFAGGVGAAPLVVTFNAAATPATAQAVLRNVLFSNTSDNPSAAPRTVRARLTAIAGQASNAPTKTINVTPKNDAPVVGGFADPSSYTPGAGPTLLDANATVADPDSANFAGGVVSLQFMSGAAGTNRLGLRHQGTGSGQIGVSGNNVSFGGVVIGTLNANAGVGGTNFVLTFNGSTTAPAVQAVLRNLTYHSTAANPIGPKTLRLIVKDGDGGAATVLKPLDIAPPAANYAAFADYADWGTALR